MELGSKLKSEGSCKNNEQNFLMYREIERPDCEDIYEFLVVMQVLLVLRLHSQGKQYNSLSPRPCGGERKLLLCSLGMRPV